jgi:uncharacterized protein YacL
MKLDQEYKNKYSERLFETLFAFVTGSVGVFFLVVSGWFGKSLIKRGNIDGLALVLFAIIVLISYWFLKLTYKLVFHKCAYLLSNLELNVTGWFFILFLPAALVINLLNHQQPNVAELMPCTPGVLYGYIALRLVKKRKSQVQKVLLNSLKKVKENAGA